ncbi:MAG: AAA family ATPase [Myroides odoratus]|jgi:energy-coupling factor transporter ATP-binding protein EcfA2|nr:AAA family ATPase [Myroides odoratus]
MSFKLLAIRPLEDTDPLLLKTLKPNYIYRFYNELDYLFESKEESEGNSFIRLQENHYEKLDKKEITAIKYNREVPSGFFGQNTNISAIVGENGSGKSSLLELYYYFLFHYSHIQGILRDNDAVLHSGQICKLELYFEYKDEIVKIVYQSLGKGLEVKQYSNDGEIFKLKDDVNGLKDTKFGKLSYQISQARKKLVLPIYNVALNYGLYGLNSKIRGYGWLHFLFHKNDGYQTPIVINPMRTYGNIDVNREYRLLAQRLVINQFVIGEETFLSNVTFNKVIYSLEVYKNQFYSYIIDEEYKIIVDNVEIPLNIRELKNGTLNEDKLVLKWFKIFLRNIFYWKNEKLLLKSFLDVIEKNNKVLLDFSLVLNYWKENIEDNDQFILNRNKSNLMLDEIQYLNLLYIFNKLRKMTLYYVEYNRFDYLFDSPSSDVFNLNKVNWKNYLFTIIKD